MNKKVLIASGSRHSIPPVKNSPGIPRIIFQLSEKDTEDFSFIVLSKYDKELKAMLFDQDKYLHTKPNFKTHVLERLLKAMPYRWRKKRYGFSQPDRIVYYKSLVQKATQQNPDIVITFMHVELFKMLQKALPEAKHVFFFRSTDLKGRIGQENIDYILKHSAGFLANTQAPVQELKSMIPKPIFPMQTIYNAIPRIKQKEEELELLGVKFRKKFGLKESDFVIGYAGRFSEEKSLIELFKVIKSLKNDGVVIHLFIAGDISNEKTPSYKYFEDLMSFKNLHLNEQIHLAGWITNTELYHFYSALDLGVLLSKYREGNSMFLIEAMSYGVPILATNIGGNIEIVQDEFNGYLIDNNNLHSSLYNTILKLFNNDSILKKISKGAYETIRINHSSERMAKLFKDFLKDI